jgi:hypothetical protein
MRIPNSKLERFVREVADECFASQGLRLQRGDFYKNYYLSGSENGDNAAIFNKTFSYIDDLESLMYSPVSLKFQLGDPDIPNVLNKVKNHAAATHLRNMARQSDIDSLLSSAVTWSLVKGKAFTKILYKGKGLSGELVQPEAIGVLRENHHSLDAGMDAFAHRMFITRYEFNRMIAGHPDEEILKKRARSYMRAGAQTNEGGRPHMQVTTGAMQPFRGTSNAIPNATNTVDWLTAPQPYLTPQMQDALLPLDEVWIWDDKRNNWATFQLIGDNMMILGKYQIINAFSWNTSSQADNPILEGKHPFAEFCPNPLDGYFWGKSEIFHVWLLQEAINARINGINKLLRQQEDPPTKFIGGTMPNQNTLAKFRKAGGYWADSNPNAKVENLPPQIPPLLFETLHEYERMFDELGGLPPIARGRGDAGVRSQGHAETLIRMFSPRFKDRALLIERDVESVGSIMLDLAKAHVADKLTAWVPQDQAGMETIPVPNPLVVPPSPGMVPVYFQYADLADDAHLTVQSHSSSPAFLAEAKSLVFDLFKIQAMTAEDVVETVDAPNPDDLISSIHRRDAAKQAALLQVFKEDPAAAARAITGTTAKKKSR